ncbi:MAG: tetratricopeptide repeat protein [Candidatus Micrarchaeota archaeon]
MADINPLEPNEEIRKKARELSAGASPLEFSIKVSNHLFEDIKKIDYELKTFPLPPLGCQTASNVASTNLGDCNELVYYESSIINSAGKNGIYALPAVLSAEIFGQPLTSHMITAILLKDNVPAKYYYQAFEKDSSFRADIFKKFKVAEEKGWHLVLDDPGKEKYAVQYDNIEILAGKEIKAQFYDDAGTNLANYGKTREGIDAFKTSISYSPNRYLPHYNLAITYIEVGELENAEKEQKSSLQLAPKSQIATLKEEFIKSYMGLGFASARAGQFGAAANSFKHVIELASDTMPEKSEAYANLAGVYADSGNLGKAIEISKQAVKEYPNSLPLHYNLGTIYLRLKKYDEALREYKCALNLAQDTGEIINIRHQLGRTQHIAGRYKEAVKEYERALELAPHAAMIHNNLGSAYIHLRDYKAAYESFKKAYELDSQNKEYQQNQDGARTLYLNSLKIIPLQKGKKKEEGPRLLAPTH